MATKTVRTATCDACGGTQEFKEHAQALPTNWAHTTLRAGLEAPSGCPVYSLDLCPACQIKALISLGIRTAE